MRALLLMLAGFLFPVVGHSHFCQTDTVAECKEKLDRYCPECREVIEHFEDIEGEFRSMRDYYNVITDPRYPVRVALILYDEELYRDGVVHLEKRQGEIKPYGYWYGGMVRSGNHGKTPPYLTD